MGLRFLRLTTVYPAFAAQFLRGQPDLEAVTHAELSARFVAARYAECDYHARHLRRLGYEAENHFASIEPLQRKWAEENGAAFRPENWLLDIAAAQVRAFEPTVLFLDDLYLMDRPFRNELRAAAGKHCRLVGWRASTTNDVSRFGDLDLVLTSIGSLADRFNLAGVPARVIPHGFEASVLEAVPPPDQRDVAFSFAGSVGKDHPERSQLVERLLVASPLEVWSEAAAPRWKDRLRWWLGGCGAKPALNARTRTLAWDYRGRVHPQVFGLAYYGLLGRSRIVLNSHISCAAADASNMRLFEATGMGACLLTDRQANLSQFFEPETEVVTYGGAEECLEKVNHLLTHEDERCRIAAAGQRRTLRDHTFAQRVERLVEVLSDRHWRAAA